MNRAQKAAVDAFLAMELHTADCWVCRKVDAEFHQAMGRQDMDEVRRLSHQFCPEMQLLAEQLTIASKAAFGKGAR